ncbi:MAG: hypothetical protein ACI4QT_05645 [Kiritimatiellia bacterium]
MPVLMVGTYGVDGTPDAAKMKPVCFDTCAHTYRIMGYAIAKAFSCGKDMIKLGKWTQIFET